jgi:hypothetical protein
VHRDNGTAFTNGQSEVDSSADVVATPAEAIAEVNAFDSDDAADCHRTTLRTGLTKGGATVTRVSYTVIPVTVRGSDVAFAYHIVLDYAAGTATTVLDSYTVQAAVGQTEITVTDSQNRGAANLGRAVDLAAIVVGRVRSAA